MSGPFGSSQWMYKSGDYEIDNSLRLEDGDNAVLERHMAAAGNTKTWTLSMWVKRGRLSADTGYENIFTSPGNSYISFTGDNDDAIRIFSHDGSLRMQLVTKQEFRDPAAWYHLVFRCDTTQGTDTNRFRFYVNGSQVTEFEASANNYSLAYPPQNHDMHWNEIGKHMIGGGDGNDGDYYVSEVNFVDGTSLGAASFGETDATYGHWKPKEYTGSHGTNGFYLDFADSGALGDDESANQMIFSATYKLDKVKNKKGTNIAYITGIHNIYCSLIFAQDSKVFEGSLAGAMKTKYRFDVTNNYTVLSKSSGALKWDFTFEGEAFSAIMEMSEKTKRMK